MDQKLYVNYPTGDSTDTFNQHVFNPITRAWSIFQNIPAHVFGLILMVILTLVQQVARFIRWVAQQI